MLVFLFFGTTFFDGASEFGLDWYVSGGLQAHFNQYNLKKNLGL
jgi:hypothetical protein